MNAKESAPRKISLGRAWRLIRPYWVSEERASAWVLLALVIAVDLAIVYLLVRLNQWNADFFNAIQDRDAGAFFRLLGFFSGLAALYIVIASARAYGQQWLQIRWRRWLTARTGDAWLGSRTYYRMQLRDYGMENPEQRIQEDINLFVSGALSLGLGFLNSAVTLASFAAILWSLSGTLDFTVLGMALSLPGYMLWAAIVYAFAGSFLTHIIGRPLVPLNFQQQRYEAELRLRMIRVRENAESIALYRGEADERRLLAGAFAQLRANWFRLMACGFHLNLFSSFYAQLAIVFPFLVAAPRYFSGAIQLGGLTQTASAFGQVQGALSWFVNAYADLASWKASVDRLIGFDDAVGAVAADASGTLGRIVRSTGPRLAAEGLDLALPDGRLLIEGARLEVAPGEAVLLSGPSGSGKSTLFRALAGLWPFGAGRLVMPEGRILFLPQKPYIAPGTLRAALCYPSGQHAPGDEELAEALRACRLDHLVDRLGEEWHWQTRLSPGEQQRLAFARAFLLRPQWLFLDEASSSLDEDAERAMYEGLRARLPDAAVLSIAHRPAVARYHTRRLSIDPATRSVQTAAILAS